MFQMAGITAESSKLHTSDKILVVEDEHLVTMYIVDLLEDLGHRVVGTASSMADALALAQSNPPEIAIVDCHLPGGADGVAVARELSRLYGTAIIFVTGAPERDIGARLADIAPVAVLVKPCASEALAEAVRKGIMQRVK